MATAENSLIVPIRLDQSPPPQLGANTEDTGHARLDTSIVESLAPTRVVVLGYWPVPDQSSPQQLRDQFGTEAQDGLEAVSDSLEDRGFEVATELSFTKDRNQVIDRVANGYGCRSVLHPGVVREQPPESVLVLVKSDSDLDRIVGTIGTLFAESTVEILLFHAVERGEDAETTEYMLQGLADRLAGRGIDPDRVRWEQSPSGPREDAIVSEVSEHDLVVLSESEPTVRERIFGPVQSAITDRTDRPSLTIRAEM